jgi:phospholipase C
MVRSICAVSVFLLACSSAPDADEGDAGLDAPALDSASKDVSPDAPIADAATGPQIKYVMVLVKENHTFDNYFSGVPGAESATSAKLSNGTTKKLTVAPDGDLPGDTCHANSCGFNAYDDGKMDGFDTNGNATQPFMHYTEQQIPNYWQLAKNFVLADHFFSTTLGPSTPGHAVFWNARSLSLDNADCPDGGACGGFGCIAGKDTTITTYNQDDCTTKTVFPCFDVPTLADHLPQGFTWMDYGGAIALMTKSVIGMPNYQSHFKSGPNLLIDLENKKISNLTIAHLSAGAASEHPPSAPCEGENETIQIINAAMALPEWKEMAIVVTWDDWGGWYDHVAPTVHKCKNGKIFNTGFRLPAIIVSPYAKQGYVLKTPAEQASVPRLVEELWKMDFMTTRDAHARDGTAGSLLGAFDFTQAPRDPIPLKTRTCP